jgi:GMP synthase (glutamine-hydrolysing)
MTRIQIIKVGSTLPALQARKGDFEDWILAGMQVPPPRVATVNVLAGEPLPGYHATAGIVVTGSHDFVTEHHDWSERTAVWLRGAVAREIPTLGICYGHQLLAYALGGKVDDNPTGREYGTLPVHLEREARTDPLLGGFSNPIHVQLCHSQAVVRLPPGARGLATSDRDRHQAFVVDPNAWGVQFHPEFDAEVVRTYIGHHTAALRAEGQEPEKLLESTVDTPYGGQILERFAALVAETD